MCVIFHSRGNIDCHSIKLATSQSYDVFFHLTLALLFEHPLLLRRNDSAARLIRVQIFRISKSFFFFASEKAAYVLRNFNEPLKKCATPPCDETREKKRKNGVNLNTFSGSAKDDLIS